MILTVRESPHGYPVTLDEAKAFLRLTHVVEDAVIETLIAAATNTLELYVNRRFLTQTLASLVPFRPGRQRSHRGLQRVWYMGGRTLFYLPLGPTQRVKSVSLITASGEATPLEDRRVHINPHEDPAFIILDVDEGWGACVEYVVGYGDQKESIPAALRLALLQWIAVLYDHRSGTLPPLERVLGETLTPFVCRKICL